MTPTRTRTSPSLVAVAAARVHDAETALHAARQSGVDAWVAAAYDRLHDALVDHAAVTGSAGAAHAA